MTVILLSLALAAGCRSGGLGTGTGTGGPPDPDTLVFKGSVHVWSATSAFALASDDSATLFAFPFDPKQQPTPIAAQMETLMVQHEVALVWHATPAHPQRDNDLGGLTIWSAAGGVRELDPSAVLYEGQAVSDGTHVAWLGGVASDRSSGDVLLDRVAQPAPHIVLPQVALAGCAPRMRFVGQRLVVAACPAGSTAASLSAIDLDSGTVTPLLASAQPRFFSDVLHARVVGVDASGAGWLIPLDGDPPTRIAADLAQARFTDDGQTLYYTDSQHQLWQLPIGGSATQLQAPPGDSLWDTSPDGRFVLYTPFTGVVDGPSATVGLAGGGQPGVTLVPAATGTLLGEGFTSDSQFALWADAVDDNFNGQIWVRPTAGGVSRQLATLGYGWQRLDQSRLIYTDHVVAYPNAPISDGTADLMYVDLAGEAPPMTLLQNVEATVTTTPDRKTLVFARRDQGDRNGLYTRPLAP